MSTFHEKLRTYAKCFRLGYEKREQKQSLVTTRKIFKFFIIYSRVCNERTINFLFSKEMLVKMSLGNPGIDG